MNERTLREEVLQQPFNLERWKEVLETAFPERAFFSRTDIIEGQKRTATQERLIKSLKYFGDVELDQATLAFIEVELNEDEVEISQNRVGLRNLVSEKVIPGVRDAAIIAYHQPGQNEWRISFYSEQYTWDDDKGIVKEETNGKRYTFVVGGDETCRTAADRLYQLVGSSSELTLKDVMEAFSVEKVSKYFFNEYKHQYDKFVKYLTGKVWTKDGEKVVNEPHSQLNAFFKVRPGVPPEKEARDFVKKLLGRIVFLYFVQKKGWLGASSKEFEDGKSDFISILFKEHDKHSNADDQFYNQRLRDLFFNGLNEEQSLTFLMPDDKTSVYIPYLNGGLFDRDDIDKKLDGFTLPDTLFHNPTNPGEPEDRFDKTNKRGFLDFLDAFNFTIHEDSPEDQTVGIDPEMLGHIFENLLEDNKEKGAFYTPKPIVHYMCQESLIEYLNTSLSGDDELRSKLEALVKKQELQEIRSYYKQILQTLKEVKICDPAIGSGAFPMGLLQEIYQIIDTISFASPDNVDAIWGLDNGTLNAAQTKKQIIQNSIYGVDIEKGAVDIAKLRFWLSLIVDEQHPSPLPNFDYKIVVGNSLISELTLDGDQHYVEINWDSEGKVEETKAIIEELEKTLQIIVQKQKDNFSSSKKKQELLKREIRDHKIDALILQLKFDRLRYDRQNPEKGGAFPSGADKKFNVERKAKIADYSNAIKKLEQAKQQENPDFNHFDWKLDFPEVLNPVIADSQAGFDIIIGNPPYIQLQKDGGYLGNLYQDKGFETFEKTGDIYTLFYEKGFHLLKENGIHTFITSNKWMRSNYGESLRKYLSNQNPLQILDLGPGVFENATVDTNILISQKRDYKNLLKGIEITDQKNVSKLSKSELLPLKNIDENPWSILNLVELKIKKRIETKGKPISKWDVNINRGVLTGFNKAFLIDELIKERLIDNHSSSKKLIVRLIRGRDIDRYEFSWKNKYLIKSFPSLNLDIKNYPAIEEYLSNYLPKLKQIGEEFEDSDGKIKRTRKKTSNKWFETQDSISYWDAFEGPKILYNDISKRRLSFAYDESGYYFNNTVYFIYGEASLKYLLAVLNSRIIDWYFRQVSSQLGSNSVRMFSVFMKKLPIIECHNKMVFQVSVNYILFIKGLDKSLPAFDGWLKDDAIRLLEELIDGLVYELYFQEEFEANDIALMPHVKKEIESIENRSEDEALEIISDFLGKRVQVEGEIHTNLQKMQTLEEVQAIENEVN